MDEVYQEKIIAALEDEISRIQAATDNDDRSSPYAETDKQFDRGYLDGLKFALAIIRYDPDPESEPN